MAKLVFGKRDAVALRIWKPGTAEDIGVGGLRERGEMDREFRCPATQNLIAMRRDLVSCLYLEALMFV